MQIINAHNRLQAKYLRLKQRIKVAIQDGRFYRYAIRKQRQLLQRLTRYSQQLLRRRQWLVPAAVVGLAFGSPRLSYGQTFTLQPNNPFELSDMVRNSSPSFADIDGDGDLDAFVGERYGNIRYFKNTGSSTLAAFEKPSTNPFGLSDIGFESAPSLVDIDGDGDLDAFVGERYGNIRYFKNTGSPTMPAFVTFSNNPFGLSAAIDQSAPSFVDIDGDGDLDAFVGERFGSIVYFKNTGSITVPAFTMSSTNPFGLSDVGRNSSPSFVDIDGDLDLDALVGETYGSIFYFENTGSPTMPAFTTSSTNPFGLNSVGYESAPSFVDIDMDGDLDALVGARYGVIRYFQNTGTAMLPAFTPTNPFVRINVNSNSSPSFVDIDGDLDLDALVGVNDGNIIYFQNTGNATTPAFATSSTNPFGLRDIGSESKPTFVDINGDGDLDALVGERLGSIIYFENIGSATTPTFAMPSINPFGLSSILFVDSAPSFADIDRDGDLDALVGEQYGNIIYFQNTGSATTPAFARSITNPFLLSDVGNYSVPSFVDIDGDGFLEAIIGNGAGNVIYFENGEIFNCNTPPPASETIASGTYQVSNTITTAGKIFSPSMVVFKAGTSITLTAGFEAKIGSTFNASIEPCASLNKETVEARTRDGLPAQASAENGLDIAPNPFHAQATITYMLAETTEVTLTIYDLQGKRIAQPITRCIKEVGSYQMLFDAQNVPKGIYVVILQTASGILSRKIVLTE